MDDEYDIYQEEDVDVVVDILYDHLLGEVMECKADMSEILYGIAQECLREVDQIYSLAIEEQLANR